MFVLSAALLQINSNLEGNTYHGVIPFAYVKGPIKAEKLW